MSRLSIVLAVAGAAIVTVLIASQRLLFGSPDGGWVHPYYQTFSVAASIPFLVAAPCVLVLVAWSDRAVAERQGLVIVAWLALAFSLQLVFRSQFPGTLASNVVSDEVNSFYSPILEYPAHELMRNFETLQPALPLHAANNMPGKVVIFYLLDALTHSPQAMAYLLIALSNFGGVLLFCVIRELFDDRRCALFSLVLYLFLPCRLYLLPRLNTVSPVLILLCLYWMVLFLRSPRPVWAILLGGSLYATAFFEPLPCAMGLLFASILASSIRSRTFTLASTTRLALWTAGAFFAAHAAMLATLDYDLFGHFVHLVDLAITFNASTDRPYAVWVVQNLVDFLINVGVASSVLFFAYLVTLARDRRAAVRDGPLALFAVATLLVLLGLDAAGVNRGEVIRLWIFLASFWIVVPAVQCARARSNLPIYAVLLAALLQASVTINMVKFGIVS